MSVKFLVLGFDDAMRRQVEGDLRVAFPNSTIRSSPQPPETSLVSRDAGHDAILVAYDHGRAEREGTSVADVLAPLRASTSLLFVLAKGGNELTAIDAMRAGAVDFIPLRLVSPPVLNQRVTAGLQARDSGAAPHADRRRAQVRRTPDPAELPAQITGYRVLQTIAHSHRSSVYLAHSRELGMNVALKVLTRGSESAETAADRDRFAREYQIIAQLRHRAIVDVYDFGSSNGISYIATEYFPAGDLRTRLRNPMSCDDAVDYLRQISEALRVLHVAGVLHRDLKPANVMLRTDNSIVLIDFGLAKALGGDKSLTGVGEIRGSPYYMSPEQGEGRALDERSDLYSLGVIFFELLTGERPFQGGSVFDILAQHERAPVPRLTGPAARFQPVVDRLLAKRPAERFQSASDLLLALTRSFHVPEAGNPLPDSPPPRRE
jgi:predicted Ser/Thr protein kinase